jgi:hypothetical protein
MDKDYIHVADNKEVKQYSPSCSNGPVFTTTPRDESNREADNKPALPPHPSYNARTLKTNFDDASP